MSRDLLWIGVLALVHVVLKYRPAWFSGPVVGIAGNAISRAAVAAQPDPVTRPSGSPA